MLATTYVGYGASTLGVDSGFANPQPAQHFGQSGSPGSVLQQACHCRSNDQSLRYLKLVQ